MCVYMMCVYVWCVYVWCARLSVLCACVHLSVLCASVCADLCVNTSAAVLGKFLPAPHTILSAGRDLVFLIVFSSCHPASYNVRTFFSQLPLTSINTGVLFWCSGAREPSFHPALFTLLRVGSEAEAIAVIAWGSRSPSTRPPAWTMQTKSHHVPLYGELFCLTQESKKSSREEVSSCIRLGPTM